MSNTDWLAIRESNALHGRGRVASLGMFIIDHFRSAEDEANGSLDEESIGGGGVYAMIAARLFLPPSHCALIIDVGADFPEGFKEQLLEYGTDMFWFRHRTGKTARALSHYSGSTIGEGTQTFTYLTERIKLTPRDLIDPECPFRDPPPEWVHIVCTAERAGEIIDELGLIGPAGHDRRPKIVWEPLSDSCKPHKLDLVLSLLPEVAAFSPNLLEAQSLLSLETSANNSSAVAAAAVLSGTVSDHCDTAIIIRAGALGSFTQSKQWTGWVPAFWTDQARVVDATGGGNAWMGGLCAGLLLTNDWRAASIFGATAASFAIEQRGLPRISLSKDAEKWNGDDPWTRLALMAERVKQTEREDTVSTNRPTTLFPKDACST